ncbi:leucyl/phenylalanyl-tRNA--protein transferase [Desulfovibrio inopinatus]|uniref:leucyl/phenylalanyl-tRNA--protein transferase n=1 Tax=Desulfovibrio inopinatus TaxID=102109 RepID=UPI0003F84C35|nr:leucyl/phenylalanyl-tRNA--protein transferase [Desulfovibrio inopinatus]
MLYLLNNSLEFPEPQFAEPDGLLAVGGDLRPDRLLAAYRRGIFPWYNDNSPILWWCPHPRLVLVPKDLHIAKSLRKVLRKQVFSIGFDTDFHGVIRLCAETRLDTGGTWITADMNRAYCRLFELGYAHCVEAWEDGELVGGIYGVAVGRAFFGESMFHLKPNASKVALVHLVRFLEHHGFHLIDCQQTTPHMLHFGATEWPRPSFLRALESATVLDHLAGPWHTCEMPDFQW